MTQAERKTYDAVRTKTEWALRALVDKATIDLVVEETLWQLHHTAHRSALIALPGVGCVLRLPVDRLKRLWKALS